MPDSLALRLGRDRVGRRDRLCSRRVQRDRKTVRPRVRRRERVGRRQYGVRVAAGECHRAGVAGRHVAVRIVRRDRHATGVPAVSLLGKPVIGERFGRRRLHRDSRLGTRDARRVRVRRRDRLRARPCPSVTVKRCVPGIGGGKRIVRRQNGMRVAAGQCHRAGITGRHVAVRVVGGHRHATRRYPPCRWWESR